MTTVEVDLWYVATTALDPDEARERILPTLSSDERVRHDRFVFDRHRHEYLMTRGLARGVLSSYVGRARSELHFTANEYGRPILEDAGELRFNLSNTLFMIACAVRRDGGEVGVDAEPLARAPEVMSVASTVFMDDERAALAALGDEMQRRRAVQLWTLKEAYMKARGLGMSIPPERFAIDFEPSTRLRFFEPIVDVPDRWRLETLEIEDHLVSLCVEASSRDARIDVKVRDAEALFLDER